VTELGCKSGRPGRGKNGIRKTGLGQRDYQKRDSETGLGKRDWSSGAKTGFGKRDSENGIRKTGLSKTGFRNGIRKTGLVVRGKNGIRKNGIRPSSRSGPARQKLDHLCLCSAVATPELQARVCMPRLDVPDLFLFVSKMAIICRKMWKKWAIL
jgi:hypothetical protein